MDSPSLLLPSLFVSQPPHDHTTHVVEVISSFEHKITKVVNKEIVSVHIKAMVRFASLFSCLLLCLPRATQSFGVSPAEAWDSYNAALVAHPLAVKSVTASVILGAADLSGQAIEASRDEKSDSSIDWARAARFSIFGLVLQAVSIVEFDRIFDIRGSRVTHCYAL